MPTPNSDIMHPGEAAAALGIDRRTLARNADNGNVPHFNTPGGHRRYRRSDIMAIVHGER